MTLQIHPQHALKTGPQSCGKEISPVYFLRLKLVAGTGKEIYGEKTSMSLLISTVSTEIMFSDLCKFQQ